MHTKEDTRDWECKEDKIFISPCIMVDISPTILVNNSVGRKQTNKKQ